MEDTKFIWDEEKEEEEVLEEKPKSKLVNPIEEYFVDKQDNQSLLIGRELFKGKKDDIDLKTELEDYEISHINNLRWNDEFLKAKGLKPLYADFVNGYLRLQVSRKRKSREEFVKSIRGDNSEIVNTMSQFKNIVDSKK